MKRVYEAAQELINHKDDPSEKSGFENYVGKILDNNPDIATLSIRRKLGESVELDICEVSTLSDDHLIELSIALTNNTTVSSVEIYNSYPLPLVGWSGVGTKAFGAALKNHSKLTELVISLPEELSVEGERILELLSCLENSVSQLILNICCWDDHFVKGLSALISKNVSLEFISLTNTSLNKSVSLYRPVVNKPPLSEKSTQELIKSLVNKPLKYLILKSIHLSDANLQEITNTVKAPILKKLCLDNAGLNSNNIRLLNDLFKNNKGLEILDLRNNQFAERGIEHALKSTNNLKTLNLVNSSLTSEVWKSLLNWSDNQLVTLDITNNPKLTETNDLIQFINHNKDLTSLYIDFSNSMIVSLAPLLKNQNPYECNLRSIHFNFTWSGGYPTQPTQALIINILEVNKQLTLKAPISDLHISILNQRNLNLRHKKKLASENAFINIAIDVCNGHHQRQNIFSRLPSDLIIKILGYLVEKYWDRQKDEVILCVGLILENLTKRHQSQITSRHNNTSSANATQSNQGISGWWFTSTMHKGENVQIFRKVTSDTDHEDNYNSILAYTGI